MASASAILAKYGLVNTDAIVTAAALEGVDIAIAATMISKESGGRNVWGSDGVSTGGAYVKGGPVTKSNYLAYRSLVKAGKIGRQGCGPAQCTSAAYQDSADAIGAPNGLGCWDPVTNIRAGLRGLGRLIKTYGIQQGARRYNGSGTAAEAYGRDFLSRYNTWSARLAGAEVTPTVPTIPEDNELTPDEHAMLQETRDLLRWLWSQVAGENAAPFQFTGWPSFENGSGKKLTLVDYERNADVQHEDIKRQLAEIKAKLDT